MSRKKSINTEISKRLLELVDEFAEGKNTVFAKKAGIPISSFHEYTKGRPPHADHLIRIYECFGVSLNWMLTGKGAKFIKKAGFEPSEEENLVEIQHMDLVKDFQDKERAKSINQKLIELERLSDTAFREMEIYIKGVVNGIKYASHQSSSGEETAETPSSSTPGAGRRLRVRKK